MINKRTGKVTRIEQKDGAYVFNIWVPEERGKDNKKTGHPQGDQNRYAPLPTVEDQEQDQDLTRLDDLM